MADLKIFDQSFILGISLAWLWCIILRCSVTKSCPTLCDSMNFIQHGRLPCPSLFLGVCWNSFLLSQWCYLTISSSAVPFFSCPQSFPASGSFPVSQFFASDGQSIGALASVLPMNIHGWFTLGLTGLISLLSQWLWRVFFSTTVWKHQFFGAQPSLCSNSHTRTWLLEKP